VSVHSSGDESITLLATAYSVLLVHMTLLAALMFLCQCDGRKPCGPCSVKNRVSSSSFVLELVIAREKIPLDWTDRLKALSETRV
jgi:hypothetical protein